MLQDVEIQKQGNSFIAAGVGGQVGEISYKLVDVDTWVIDHTFVEPDYREGNLARELLDRVVNEARENGRKIIPSCAYALKQFQRNPEYEDVWQRDHGELTDPYSSDGVN